MQGIYTYISETNYVPREYSIAAILLLLIMVFISLVPELNLLYFCISTSRSICAVPNMAVLLLLLLFVYHCRHQQCHFLIPFIFSFFSHMPAYHHARRRPSLLQCLTFPSVILFDYIY